MRCCLAACLAQQKKNPGYTDTAILPGQSWHVHDSNRPHPNAVQPGKVLGAPPSDATVLFDGTDLSRWMQRGRGADRDKMTDAKWRVADGYFECVPGTGSLITREKFGDVQLHIEWMEPPEIKGQDQDRGNSGVLLMDRYEIQVLESSGGLTYADGQAGALYGQWPPLVNPIRPQGEWQAYDIVFRGSAVRRREAGEERLCHGVLQRSAGTPPQRDSGHDGAPRGGQIQSARERRAALAAGSRAQGSIPEYVDPAVARVRSGGAVAELRLDRQSSVTTRSSIFE